MNKEEIRYSIRTFGCQMNVNDSEKVDALFAARGWTRVEDASHADVLFVNTCAVRQKAEDKLFTLLGRLPARHEGGSRAQLVALGGCVAQLHGAKLLNRRVGIDVLVGPRSLDRLPDLVERALEDPTSGPSVALDVRGQDPFTAPLPPFVVRGARVRAHVTVMEGCSQVCSFCVVPRTRGTGVFRDPEDVLAEVKRHVEGSQQEIVLLGQTVNAYSHGETDFAELLSQCASVPGLRRLRFATSHPNHVTGRLASVLGRTSNICPHLHLPVQSGSDDVLAAMRRGYSRNEYLEKLALVRGASRDIAIWTDVIVGHPGETDGDFQATLDLIDVAGFAGLYAFIYSPRPGTTAFRLADDVPDRVKRERLAEVNRRQQDLQLGSNQRRVGRVEDVLIESVGRDRRLEGRAPDNRVVHCDGSPEMVGSIVRVLVTSAGPNALVGRPASEISA